MGQTSETERNMESTITKYLRAWTTHSPDISVRELIRLIRNFCPLTGRSRW